MFIKQTSLFSHSSSLLIKRTFQSTSTTQNILSPMSFRTELIDKPSNHKISYDSSIFFLGSCFSEHIFQLLKQFHFQVYSNPQGILFNPISIQQCIQNIIQPKVYSKDDLFYSKIDSLFHSWDHHSQFSTPSLEQSLLTMNQTIQHAHQVLQQCNYVFITLGSSHVFKHKENQQIVANCHKQPGNLFDSRWLTVQETKQSLHKIIQDLQQFNPTIKIVFTVSPIRHTKEGIIENMRSKSTLLCAIHEICEEINQQTQTNKKEVKEEDTLVPMVSYFPSYEYMLDDLRDYRWYEEDMIHPNTQAIQYIFHKFLTKYMTSETMSILQDIQRVLLNLNHRPRFQYSQQYIKHLQTTLQTLQQIENKHQQLSFDIEKQQLIQTLQSISDQFPTK